MSDKSKFTSLYVHSNNSELKQEIDSGRLYLSITNSLLGRLGAVYTADGLIENGTATCSALEDYMREHYPVSFAVGRNQFAHKFISADERSTLIRLSIYTRLTDNEPKPPLIPASIVNIDERDARTLLYEFKTKKDMQDYRTLLGVLFDSLDQAAYGKGKERHANDLPFEEQRMTSISKALNSPLGMAYQAIKKVQEGVQFEETERVIKELHGAIVYIAGMILWYQNQPPK